MLARADTLTADEDPAYQWILLAGVFLEVAQSFDSRFRTTATPTDYLWGPGSAAQAHSWLAANEPVADAVDTIDQLLLVRHHGTQLYQPQTPQVASALPPDEQTGQWWLICADHPRDALACVRKHLNREDRHPSACTCATQRLRCGTWQEIRRRLAQLHPDLEPALPPDISMHSWNMSKRSIGV